MKRFIIALALTTMCVCGSAATIKVPVRSLVGDYAGKQIGYVLLTDTRYGLLITPALQHLKPGLHGMHIHVNPSCANHGMAAGGHLDPMHTGKHLGPYNPNGHLGDLPTLYVASNGTASLPVLAPKLNVNLARHHSIMIHAGGDNYADSPKKLGGGGARVACGVIN